MEIFSIDAFTSYIEKHFPDILEFIGLVILSILAYCIGVKIINWICRILKRSLEKANVDVGAIQFLHSLVKALLYFILIVSIAVRFGIKESSVAALLASGGVALGLALQGGLSNLAGGVIILWLKPFQVGDYIIENNEHQEGTVLKIEMFYTTLTTPDNKRITIPNGALTDTSIVNVTAQETRKLVLTIGISYQADLKKAKSVIEMLLLEDKSILSEEEMSVYVDELAESTVNIGFFAWVKTEDYRHTKWRLNEKIKLAFDAVGIEIPYQQMDIHIRSDS